MITILNSYIDNGGWQLVTFSFGLLFTLVVFFVGWSAFVDGEDMYGTFLVFFAIILTACCINLFVEMRENERTTRYEVLIADDVPFVEVMEKYNVDSKRGDLWILSDKVEEEE